MRLEIDMTELMNTIFSKMGAGMEELDVKMDKYTMRMDIGNINKVKPFKIPSSVIKAAKDAA